MIDPPPVIERGVPKSVRLWLNRLRDFCIANRPLSGPGCNIYRGRNGSLIDPITQPGGSDAPAIPPHPFQVLTRVDEDGDTFAGVVYDSKLFRSLGPNDLQTITGLLGPDLAPDDPGWVAVAHEDLVILEVTFNTSMIPTSAEIVFGQEPLDIVASPWDTGSIVEDDGDEDNPRLSVSRKMIAQFIETGGQFSVNQRMFDHQILKNTCIAGRPAKYPMPL
jgi:hypothetical protein